MLVTWMTQTELFNVKYAYADTLVEVRNSRNSVKCFTILICRGKGANCYKMVGSTFSLFSLWDQLLSLPLLLEGLSFCPTF